MSIRYGRDRTVCIDIPIGQLAEVAGRECHKHHVKDVRFINRRLLFRVKPALGLVPLGGASSFLSFSFLPGAVGRCYTCISVYTTVD